MIKIVNRGITDVKADCIVNAANEGLWQGSGVCGAIFKAAGAAELTKACDRIGHCNTGSAVITPAFNLDAKYIIHAVGPVWEGGSNGEAELLRGAYATSLGLAKEKGCKSIVFPLISAGIFGYPKEDAWRIALDVCKGYDMDTYFAVPDVNIARIGQGLLDD